MCSCEGAARRPDTAEAPAGKNARRTEPPNMPGPAPGGRTKAAQAEADKARWAPHTRPAARPARPARLRLARH
jgi:hypothetical protein